MIYASIDLETTGLDPETCQIIEFGMYIEDTTKMLPREKLPYFHCYINNEFISGEAYALNMHLQSGLLQKIIDKSLNKKVDGHWLNLDYLHTCIVNHFTKEYEKYTGKPHKGKISVAGKNFNGLDKNFLVNADKNFKNLFHHRVIDPAILYYDKKLDKEVLPDLSTCKKRAGLNEIVTHNALDDAWDVIQLLRLKDF
jgi:oligoribonuclease (3'-5' exoribonuclease)